MDWIIGGGEDADTPAYFLADLWYDVWIGNNRGNMFSLKHKELNYAKDAQYWNFTFKEMGDYDAPAQVQYIIDKT